MDLSDHGLGQGLDARHEAGASVEQILEPRGPVIARRAQCRQLLEVMTGAKCLARAGEDDNPYIGAMRDLVQARLQRGQHFV